MLSVVLFTEEPVVGIGVRAMLAAEGEFRLARVCTQPAELLETVASSHPDLVIYTLEPVPDLHALGEVCAVDRNCRVVLLSREITPELAYQVMDLGVKGMLGTTADSAGLHECLRSAAEGQLWLDPSVSIDLIGSRPIGLSPRQSELLSLLTQGLKNREIGAAMGISEGTVKAYMTTLFEKVGAKDRFELALFGLKNLRHLRTPVSNRQKEAAAFPAPLRRNESRRTVA